MDIFVHRDICRVTCLELRAEQNYVGYGICKLGNLFGGYVRLYLMQKFG